MEPLVVSSNHASAGVGVCAAQAAWVAIQTIDVNSSTDVVVVSRPALASEAFLIVSRGDNETCILKSLLDLLHVDDQGIVGIVLRFCEFVLDLSQDDRTTVGDLVPCDDGGDFCDPL